MNRSGISLRDLFPHTILEEKKMQTLKQRTVNLMATSLIATTALLGASGIAAAAGRPTDLPGAPAPSLPNIPDNPIEEGVPVPIPGGGA